MEIELAIAYRTFQYGMQISARLDLQGWKF